MIELPVREPRPLDLDAWPRREHFRFFRTYDNPYFNVCANVDVTGLVERTRAEHEPSFFVASLWLSLEVANALEPFRYRIRGDGVIVHPQVHGGSTVLVEDETFRFAYFPRDPDFERFAGSAGEVLASIQADPGPLDPADDRDDVIHYSVLPWISFTSFSHARRWGTDDAVPKIVFGRHRAEGARRVMPVSVEVHHALMDGLHVARFYERFRKRIEAFG